MSWLLPALLLALTPLIWRQASTAPITLVPVVLIAVWLFAVASLQGARATVWAIVAGGVLGAGMYVSPPSAVMMPILAVITIGCVAQARAASMRDLGIFVAAFAIVSAPFAIALMLHPEEFRRLVLSHHLYDANRFNILQGFANHELGRDDRAVGCTGITSTPRSCSSPGACWRGRWRCSCRLGCTEP